jgi:hypothetical protein
MEDLPHHVLFKIAHFTDIHSFLSLFSSSSHNLHSFLRGNENLLYRDLVFRDFPDNVTDVENLGYPHFWLEHYLSTYAKMKKRDELRRKGRALLEQCPLNHTSRTHEYLTKKDINKCSPKNKAYCGKMLVHNRGTNIITHMAIRKLKRFDVMINV